MVTVTRPSALSPAARGNVNSARRNFTSGFFATHVPGTVSRMCGRTSSDVLLGGLRLRLRRGAWARERRADRVRRIASAACLPPALRRVRAQRSSPPVRARRPAGWLPVTARPRCAQRPLRGNRSSARPSCRSSRHRPRLRLLLGDWRFGRSTAAQRQCQRHDEQQATHSGLPYRTQASCAAHAAPLRNCRRRPARGTAPCSPETNTRAVPALRRSLRRDAFTSAPADQAHERPAENHRQRGRLGHGADGELKGLWTTTRRSRRCRQLSSTTRRYRRACSPGSRRRTSSGSSNRCRRLM